jgi:hypothetical protein
LENRSSTASGWPKLQAKEAEVGWQRAVDKIGERASLTRSPLLRRNWL